MLLINVEADAEVQLTKEYGISSMTQQYEPVVELLLTLIETNPGFQQNYAQRAMLRLIKLHGRKHPLIGQYRSHLQRYAH